MTTDPEHVRWDVQRRLMCYEHRPHGSPILDGSYPSSPAPASVSSSITRAV
jgi:hypothetical protein